MFLSRVELATSDRRKIKDLTHLGAFHNWVETSFPAELQENIRTRKLWRLDKLAGKEYLLLVSENQPDLTCLEKYGVRGTAQTKNYDPFLSQLHDGQTCRFKVVLNPVMALSQGHDQRGRIVPLLAVQRQGQYLEDRAEGYGFALLDYTITERGYGELKKAGRRPVRLNRVAYQGRLQITDADTFRQTLIRGMGKKKAYGFGLMTVIPEQ
jgi:CRISPR system Cascade subunit CasE